jgi:hypothetical protein
MPLIQPPAKPPKKVTIAVRFQNADLFELRRYGAFLGTRNRSHIIVESLKRIYRMDSEYKAWLKDHPNFQPELKTRRNGATRTSTAPVLSGAAASSAVAAAEAARRAGV